MKILLALRMTDEKIKKIGDALVAKAKADDIELSYDAVVSEVAIRNKLNEQHYDALITQAKLETKPFSIDTLSSISEIDESTKLIIVIPPESKGTKYCSQLLDKHLLYGIFPDNANPTDIYALLKGSRTRSEAKAYYQIVVESEVEEKLEKGILPEEIRNMAKYITYGSEGYSEDLKTRLDYMASRCSEQEIEAVFAALSEEMREKVSEIQPYSKYFYTPMEAPTEAQPSSKSQPAEVKPSDTTEHIVSISKIKEDQQRKSESRKTEPKTEEPQKKAEKKSNKDKEENSLISAIAGLKSFTKSIIPQRSKSETPEAVPVKPSKAQTAKQQPSTQPAAKYITRKVIGVIGAYPGAGTTTVAVSLAATIAQYEPVSLLEMPRNSMAGIYETFSLDEKVGPKYKSVPHIIAGGDNDLTTVQNIYNGINFFVPNNAYGYEPLTPEQVTLMLNGTSDTVVIDLGTSLDEVCELGLANQLTHMVLVFSAASGNMYLSKIKADIARLESMNLVQLAICIDDKRASGSGLYDDMELIHAKSVIGQKIIPLGLGSEDKALLLDVLGIAASSKRKFKVTKKNLRGVVDVAVAGSRPGVGTTYTALMLADSLRKSYRVAYFEYNSSGHMQALANEYNSDEDNHISISGVDIYFNMEYSEFASSYRADYDYVFIDFGTITKLNRRKDVFSSCQYKFVCIPTSIWKIGGIENDIDLIESLDPSSTIELLAPLATKKTLKDYDVFKRCGRRSIIPIPYAEEPLACIKETAEYLKKLFD